MKLLGHVYVAAHAFPEKNIKLLAMGAVLPEIVFYVKTPTFSYYQLHEGGLHLYQYLIIKHKELSDLALGILTHSHKYGADKFGSPAYLKQIGFVKTDLAEVAEALRVPEEIAEARTHNLYGLAIEHCLATHNPEVVGFVEKTKELDIKNLSKILADCFKVNPQLALKNIKQIMKIYDLKLVKSYKGLAILWRRLAKNLPEKDPVDIDKTAALIEKLYIKAKPSLPKYLEKVIRETRKNVLEAIKKVEKKIPRKN